MTRKAIIFTNGDLADLKYATRYIKDDDFIICADGGIGHVVKLKLHPHVVIGDMDSLPPSVKKTLNLESITWIQHPKEKDQTDTELAIRYAIGKKYKKIFIFGLLGSSIDHLTANLLLLAHPQFSDVDITIVEGKQEIFVVRKEKIIKGKKGDRLSLIPLKNDACGITLLGLKYQLRNATLKFSHTQGISNMLIQNKAIIRVEKGVLLTIHQIH